MYYIYFTKRTIQIQDIILKELHQNMNSDSVMPASGHQFQNLFHYVLPFQYLVIVKYKTAMFMLNLEVTFIPF